MSHIHACIGTPTQPINFSSHSLTKLPRKFNAPQLLAYSAAVLLAVASATTNVSSAIAKHDSLSGQFIAGSVALAVAVLALIALPAALASLRDRQYTNAALAALAFTLAATFSISAALGTLGKPRLESSLHADADVSTRTRLNAERNRVLAELATLAPARASAELNSLVAAKLATSGANGCVKTDGPISTRICSEVASLQSEAQRFERISALSGTVARIDGQLSALGRPSIANSDAAALVAVAAVFGVTIDPNAVNVGLMCLAVAILEVGSGLSLAVAQSMRVASPVIRDVPSIAQGEPMTAVVSVPAIIVPTTAKPANGLASDAAKQVLDLVRNAGGELHVASKNALAKQVGASSGTLNRALASLAGIAVIAATADGVFIKLAV